MRKSSRCSSAVPHTPKHRHRFTLPADFGSSNLLRIWEVRLWIRLYTLSQVFTGFWITSMEFTSDGLPVGASWDRMERSSTYSRLKEQTPFLGICTHKPSGSRPVWTPGPSAWSHVAWSSPSAGSLSKSHCHCPVVHSCWHFSPSEPGLELILLLEPVDPANKTTKAESSSSRSSKLWHPNP